jgi:dinuclear metal center YbgI/SA1388 family protein
MPKRSTQPDALTVGAIADFLVRFAPPGLAADWDNVGLLLGDRAAPVRHALTCLTVTPDVAAEAVASKAQLLITHHPILFRPVRRLTAAEPEGRMLLDLIRAGVSVYSPHSAFDNTQGGINDELAGRLGLADVTPLRPRASASACKLVVFVPESDLGRVSDALFAAGAGRIGEYRECSFRLAGMGTFFGSEETKPTVGQKGRREEVGEWRLEVVCPASDVDRVVAAMRRAHSYEEPAYDVYPLRPGPSEAGEGRVGRLRQPTPLATLARTVQKILGAALVQGVGEGDRQVERVAVACGAGGEFLADAARTSADVFLTGELRFHDCLRARALGLAVLLPGHYATERFAVEDLAGRLQSEFPALDIRASQAERDPLATF